MDVVNALTDFQAPTLDRPFGLHLWSIFDAIFTKVRPYGAAEFRFVPESTPISTIKESVGMIIAYYAIIFGGRELMRNQKPLQLKFLFQVHNLFLTCISFSLLVLFAEQLIPTLVRHGLFYAICDTDGGWTPPMVILYYVCSPGVAGARVVSARL